MTRCLPTVSEPERRNFAVKIFILLLLQLGVTFGYVLLANQWDPLNSFYVDYPVVLYVSFPAAIIAICLIFCCAEKLKNYPGNYIAMFFAVAVVSFGLGSLVAFLPKETVASACLCCICIMIALLLYSICVRA